MDVLGCPSLHQRKEGQPSEKEKLRSHKREAGRFSTSPAKGKPPRMREQMLREISITHPTPPCGDARRGMWLALKSSQVIGQLCLTRRGILPWHKTRWPSHIVICRSGSHGKPRPAICRLASPKHSCNGSARRSLCPPTCCGGNVLPVGSSH